MTSAQVVELGAQTNITQEQWKQLVAFLHNDPELALATRMFYLQNTHSTHPFDYYVVENGADTNSPVPKVQEYVSRARELVERLSQIAHEDHDLYFVAARIMGAMNRGDFETFAFQPEEK